MLEKVIEKKLVKEINKLGGMCLKFTTPSLVGVPDRMCLLAKGKIYFVETKRPNGKLRPVQEVVKRKLEKLGFKIYVIDSLMKVEKFIYEVKGGDANDL